MMERNLRDDPSSNDFLGKLSNNGKQQLNQPHFLEKD
jgi:hypothetical protein